MNRLKVINIASQRFHSGTDRTLQAGNIPVSVDTHNKSLSAALSDDIWFLMRMNGRNLRLTISCKFELFTKSRGCTYRRNN